MWIVVDIGTEAGITRGLLINDGLHRIDIDGQRPADLVDRRAGVRPGLSIGAEQWFPHSVAG